MGQAKGRGRDLFYRLSRGGDAEKYFCVCWFEVQFHTFWAHIIKIQSKKVTAAASFTTHKYDALGALFIFFGAQKSEI